jgi:hypothetical protein
MFMKKAPILSTTTAAPVGAKAGWPAPSDLLLLLIIRMLILWAQGIAASLRQRTETADLTEIVRTFGTTDIALILERITCALQRLQALEAKVLRHAAALDPDPQFQPMGAAASPRIPSAPQPPLLQPEDVQLLSLLAPELIVAAPVRATGPPHTSDSARKSQRGRSILSNRGAWPAPSCRFPIR